MKISYSIANTWWSGDKEKAIAMIMEEPIENPLAVEKAFAFGSGAHLCWELESKITGKLPAMFELPQFEVVRTELYLRKELPTAKGDLLSGRIDAVAIGEMEGEKMAIIVDYKTGNSFNPLQGDVYHYLVDRHPWWLENIGDVRPTHCFFLTMDKKIGTTGLNIIQLSYPTTAQDWLDPEATTLTRGQNFICTVMDEIKQYIGLEEAAKV